MESKTKSERYYNALLDDPKRACKIFIEMLEVEENLKIKPGTDENDSEN